MFVPGECIDSTTACQNSPGFTITCFLQFLYNIFKIPWEICYMVMRKRETIMSLTTPGCVYVVQTLLWGCTVVLPRCAYVDELASHAHCVWPYCRAFHWFRTGIYIESIFLYNPSQNWPAPVFNQHAKCCFKWPLKVSKSRGSYILPGHDNQSRYSQLIVEPSKFYIIYIHVYIYIHIYMYIYTCIYACMYVWNYLG